MKLINICTYLGKVNFRPIYLVGVLFAIASTSCYHDLDMNSYRTPEEGDMLTLNSLISADSIVKVKATKPFFFTDEHEENEYIKDLDISLKVNGEYVETMRFDNETKYYLSGYTAMPGDRIEISTFYNGGEVSAHDAVPQRPVIEEIKASIKEADHNAHIITYYITFTDQADTEDYYFLALDDKNVTMGWRLNMQSPGYSQEPVFQILAEQLKSAMPGWEPFGLDGLPFSDRGINGTTHTLTITEKVRGYINMIYIQTIPRNINLYSISKDYYNFLLSMIIYMEAPDNGLHGGLIDLGLVEQQKVFTNIHGGIGIMGCSSLCRESIDVLKLVTDK